MFSYEIYEIFKNTFFEEHLRMTASGSSSFKLDLIDLTVSSDLNLRLTKFKPFTTLCISSNISRSCSHAFSFLCYQVPAVTLFLSYVIKFLQSHFLFPMLSSSKMTELFFFSRFQRIDVKSNICHSAVFL